MRVFRISRGCLVNSSNNKSGIIFNELFNKRTVYGNLVSSFSCVRDNYNKSITWKRKLARFESLALLFVSRRAQTIISKVWSLELPNLENRTLLKSQRTTRTLKLDQLDLLLRAIWNFLSTVFSSCKYLRGKLFSEKNWRISTSIV